MRTLPLTNRGLHLPTIVTLGLLTLLAALLASASAVSAQSSAPVTPERPTGTVVFIGGVDLEWNDVPGADSYVVQLYRNGQWIDLPGDGVEIAFYGAGAIIRELDPTSSLWFQVRARNAHGISDWSDFHFMASTNQYESGRQARPDNVVASGAPVINGTPLVGETLSADTTGIVDANGLDRVEFRFQWVSNNGSADTDITGGTDSTYTLVADDAGKPIKVRVSFTDRGGYAETLTSDATVAATVLANSPATGAPTITGTAQVGQTLTADTAGIADDDGLSGATFSYQWVGNDGNADTDITGATDSSYTLVADDEGRTIKVRVSFTDDAGYGETLASAATTAVEASEPPSYITVAVAEDSSDVNNIVTSFTITWNDADDCSTNYNAYLNIKPGNRPGHETPGSQLHLGSAALDSTQITKGLTGVQGPTEGFDVELYCGTDGSGRLISRVDIPSDSGRPMPGTYSTEPPLNALSVSHGTLTPTFNSYTSPYTVPDVANAVTRITITATPKTGYAVDIFEASYESAWGIVAYTSKKAEECKPSYVDALGPVKKLTDADPNTPGFQVDLYDGENHIMIRVYPTAYCSLGEKYGLAITRAAGSVSLVRPNRPATGEVSIGPSYVCGPCVGLTMIADGSRVYDRDGMDNAIISYQWLADDVEISGATSPSYTVTDAELGKTLKARVSFTDDRGTEESLNSNATKVVKLLNFEPAGKPVILGKLEVGQTLTADVSSISDPNGMTNATLSYEWVNFYGPVRDRDEYTLVDRDGGRSGMWLWVTYTDDAGHEERVTSESIGVVAARPSNPATGAPVITGTAQVGETLTADTSDIADDDGLSGATFSYQWVSNDGTTDTDIAGSTDSTYTSVAADEDKTIKVKVSFTDDAGFDETLTSTATEAVSFAVQQQRANSPASGAPAITGTAQVGETLTADTAGIADNDGLSGATFSYQWVANDGTTDADITNATDSSYTLVAAEVGTTIKLKVNFTDDAGFDETLTSEATATVEAAPNNPATGAPSISGTAEVGEPLTADVSGIADDDGLSGSTFSYQWISNDGTTDTDITGATSSSYTLVAADEGKSIKVRVSFTDDAGFDETLTSTATEEVSFAVQQQRANSPATGGPAITGTAQVGETLTADTSGIADADGLSGVTFSYQWVSNDGTSDTDITGETNSTYTLVATDEGNTFKVRVSFTDDAANEETLTSEATAVVVARPNSPAAGAPVITGTAQVGKTLSVDTSGITDANGLTNAQFAYQWVRSSTDADISGSTGATYTLPSTDIGSALKVRVSFTDDDGYSETVTSAATNSVEAEIEPEVALSQTQANSEPPSHITVAVTENTSDPNNVVTNFTITWNDADDCSTNYNAYLNIYPGNEPGHETPGSQLHLGSAAFDSTQISKGLTGVQGPLEGFNVELYCGTDGSGRLISRVDIPSDPGRPKPSTYSSEPPLSALSVSHGTLTPTFNSYTSSYTVPDVANDVTRITITATPKTGYFTNFFEASDGLVLVVGTFAIHANGIVSGLSAGCNRVHYDDLGPLIELTDADLNTPGFQVDLYDGENYVHVRVYPTAYCHGGTGYQLTITRAAGSVSLVRPNRPATGYISIGPAYTRGPCVGCTMSADVSEIYDRDGLANATFGYQWLADDAEIAGATGSRYTVAATELGSTLKVRVSFTDDRGNEEIVTSSAKTKVVGPNIPASGAPYISGTPKVGETLTAETNLISDADGMEDAVLMIQWIRNDGITDTDIPGTWMDETYEVVSADEGNTLKVRVSFWDDAMSYESLTSAATATVAGQTNSLATGVPTITGTAQVGETLTADTASITDADGLTNASYSYQWISNDGSSDTDITGATDSTYTLVAADEGRTIKVKVTFTDDAGFEETLTSTATASVVSASEGASGQGSTQNSPATGAPTISGTAQVGETLTADTSGIADSDGLASVSYSYQWIRNDGTSDSDITDATGSSYTLVDADEGNTTKVKVTFTDDADNDETLTSTATSSVAARPNSEAAGAPTISGTAQVGETLTADTSGITDSDGLTSVSYSYQWISNDGTSDTEITGATDSTYTLVAADEGKTIKVRVSFTDDADNDEGLISTATDEVAAAPLPLTVSLANNPASHNGTDVFTFQIRFSEETRLSFRTLRDQAFTVTGGTVKKAKRQVKGSNMGWTITVEPDSNAAVEIVLPTTTDCATTGAICTGEGRKLSNRLEFRVSGPNQ